MKVWHVLALILTLGITSALMGQDTDHNEEQPKEEKPVRDMIDEPHEFNPNVPTQFSGRDITIKGDDGVTARAYVSGNPSSDRQIILFHEFWGLNEHIKGLADQFAAMGYRAYAADLYDGKVAADQQEARRLVTLARENPEPIQEKVNATIAYMTKENPDAKLATIGWCFGGTWSLRAAIHNPEAVDVCVIYYGHLINDVEQLRQIDSPVLGVFAKNDGSITPEVVKEFEAAMKEAGKDLRVEMYDADHAFANPSGQRFKEEAARDAWKKTIEFLDENMK